MALQHTERCSSSLTFSPIRSPETKRSEEIHWRGCGDMYAHTSLSDGQFSNNIIKITNALSCTGSQTQGCSCATLLYNSMALCNSIQQERLQCPQTESQLKNHRKSIKLQNAGSNYSFCVTVTFYHCMQHLGTTSNTYCLFLFKVQLINNVGLISGTQQSGSDIYTKVYSFSDYFPPYRLFEILHIVPCATQ